MTYTEVERFLALDESVQKELLDDTGDEFVGCGGYGLMELDEVEF